VAFLPPRHPDLAKRIVRANAVVLACLGRCESQPLLLALLESQERTGKLIVVGEGLDNVFISDVNRGSANAHDVIRCRSVLELRGNAAQQPERWADHSCRQKHASFGQKFPTWRA